MVTSSRVQIPLDGHVPNQAGPDQTRPDIEYFASRVYDQVADMSGSG